MSLEMGPPKFKQPVIEKSLLTKEKLKEMQTLEIEIKGNLNEILNEVNNKIGVELQPRPDGYHLTIITPTESKILATLDENTLTKLKQINEQIQKGEGIIVKGVGFIDGASNLYNLREVDKVKKTAFIALDIPTLQEFRAEVGLPPKDFHITLGFIGGDIHMQIIGQEPVKPGNPKMKDVITPIPKHADSRFSEIKLPKMSYGELDGQMRGNKA